MYAGMVFRLSHGRNTIPAYGAAGGRKVRWKAGGMGGIFEISGRRFCVRIRLRQMGGNAVNAQGQRTDSGGTTIGAWPAIYRLQCVSPFTRSKPPFSPCVGQIVQNPAVRALPIRLWKGKREHIFRNNNCLMRYETKNCHCRRRPGRAGNG